MYRSSFVSNSSSSSFVVAMRGELTKEALLDRFLVPESSPLYYIAGDIAQAFVRNIDAKISNVEELFSYYNWMESIDIRNRMDAEFELLQKGLTLYIGSFSDEVDRGEPDAYLCYAFTEHKADDFFVRFGGGY